MGLLGLYLGLGVLGSVVQGFQAFLCGLLGCFGFFRALQFRVRVYGLKLQRFRVWQLRV